MHGIETTVESSFADTEVVVRGALAAEGFGVLSEIDVAATLKAKLDVDRPPLKILGACNASLAHRALEIDPSVALVLPCNVVLEAVGGGTRVAIADPRTLLASAALAEVAAEAAARLTRVSGALRSA
ncbi:MAG: DUF302 domain-containing protein [Acidimicrobiales bacterium]|jgi:uncharacterized protein (DUF302 family)